MNRGHYLDPAGGKLPRGDYAKGWAAGLGHLKPSTGERYRGIVRKHLVPRGGPGRWRRWLTSDVAAWVGELSAGGLAASTVRQIHRVFSLIMAMAVQDGRIGRNPGDRDAAAEGDAERAEVPERPGGGEAGPRGRYPRARDARAGVHRSAVRGADRAPGRAGGLRAAPALDG